MAEIRFSSYDAADVLVEAADGGLKQRRLMKTQCQVGKRFFFLQDVHTCNGAYPASNPIPWLLPGGKAAGA